MFVIENKLGAIIHMTVRKDGTGEIVKQTPKFQNIVLNSGLEMMGVTNWGRDCMVGTGSSEPNVTQTTLDNPIAMTSTVTTYNDVSNRLTKPYYAALVRTYRFPTGDAVGNLTEVCIGNRETVSGGSSPVYKWRSWNRALIKDAQGNPTTLTILPDEFLDVTVEIRVYPAEKVQGTFRFLDKLGNVKSTHDFTGYPHIGNVQSFTDFWRPYQLSLYKGVTDNEQLKDPSKNMVGTRVAFKNGSIGTIVGGTQMTSDYVFGLTEANDTVNGVYIQYTNILTGSGGIGYKLIFTNPITKSNQEEHTWRPYVVWGQYTGGG